MADSSFASQSSAHQGEHQPLAARQSGLHDVEVRLRRRRQAVVVRAGDARGELELEVPRGRRRMPTLLGLDQRERLDTLYDEDVTSAPASHTRLRLPSSDFGRREHLDTLHDEGVVPLAELRLPESRPGERGPCQGRVRPRVLIDDVDDDLARRYRAEAELILREGLLASEDRGSGDPDGARATYPALER